jgi:hypothetical protein
VRPAGEHGTWGAPGLGSLAYENGHVCSAVIARQAGGARLSGRDRGSHRVTSREFPSFKKDRVEAKALLPSRTARWY